MKKLIAVIVMLMAFTVCAFAETAAQTQLPAFDHSGYDPYTAAVCEWLLANEAGDHSQSCIAIPAPVIIQVDDGDPNDILVWGIFRIDSYELRNTTLMSVSGSSTPGLMHIKETDGTYAVVEFESVGEGSDSDEGTERIFGMREGLYDRYRESTMTGEAVRLQFVSDYVNLNGLNILQIQDFGHDPVPLINAPDATEEDQMILHESVLGYSVVYDLRLFSFLEFDESMDCFCGVGELEGISVNVSRYEIPAEEAAADLAESMEVPVKEIMTIGAESMEVTLLYDEALPEGVHKNNYIVPMADGCLVVSTSNTYYASYDMETVPGADTAIDDILETFRLVAE